MTSDRTPRGLWLILLCFFVSGACGLIYEIIWSRLLALVMGATVYSLTTVLVAFMAGLGLGAWVITGPLRRHPEWSRLRLYGIFEILIGLYCLALPWLFDAVRPVFTLFYNSLYGNDPASLFTYSLAQFGICAPLMLLPTTLMGATLPILADHVARSPDRVGRAVGLVYGINTFGAVIGAVGAGYLLIPMLGFSGTNLLAVSGNLLVGATALWLAGSERSAVRAPDVAETGGASERAAIPRSLIAVVFLIFGLSGLASMTYQIAWTRVVSLIIDSTTYSFTIIVTCFILGLALGASLLSRMVDREPRPLFLLGLVEAGIGLTAMASIPILGLLSAWVFFLMIRFHESWILLQGILFALVFGLFILPTMLMGATFPLVARTLARKRGEVGSVVGRAYAANAVGTIVGSFAAGFLLIPHPAIGMERALILATALNVGLGLMAVLVTREIRAPRRAVTTLALVGLWVGGFFICVPINSEGTRGWDRDVITSSPFFFYEQFFQGAVAFDLDYNGYLAMQGERADYREGPFSTVVIRRDNRTGRGRYMIFTGGRPEASDADPQQNVLMHLGMLLHPDPRRVCCVGLGSGSTARAATYHPSLEHLDVVEISGAVADLSAQYFPEIHADLERVGANIIVADGRNHLALTDQMYDVIVSQPSHPHLTGVASLFTRDFFEICRDRLEPGGICVIWNFSWRIRPDMFRAYVRSFQEVFPACFLVLSEGSYTFMVGFKDDRPRIDWDTLAERLAACTDPALREDITISEMGQGPNLFWYEPQHVLDFISLGPRGVARYAGEGPINTDDNALLEFALPQSFDRDDTREIRRAVRFARDQLRPRAGGEYDPSQHEWIWEYVEGAPPGLGGSPEGISSDPRLNQP